MHIHIYLWRRYTVSSMMIYLYMYNLFILYIWKAEVRHKHKYYLWHQLSMNTYVYQYLSRNTHLYSEQSNIVSYNNWHKFYMKVTCLILKLFCSALSCHSQLMLFGVGLLLKVEKFKKFIFQSFEIFH